MSFKKFLIGTVVGGTAVFVAGLLLFRLAPFSEFYRYALTSGAAVGVARESPVVWAALLGALSYGALVTLAIGSRTPTTGILRGSTIGAVVGFLVWFSADFMLFATSEVGTLTSTIVGPFLEMVPGAVAGASVATLLARVGEASPPARASNV